ncbi:MAG: site-specific integrase [Melioribacteraceae bacterium]|nr:site-specific integrase [Melioribacteraceae bacterium]MCF8265254.1 site-specific integrase [Melioribacteraceae bacterium]MCF8412951.1 site-specific integrase [Melioribacteraceae bacterium]
MKNGNSSIYLDIYYKGIRKYEFLGLSYSKNDKNKKQIKEIAEKIRAKKELELGIVRYDIDTNLLSDKLVIEYFDSKALDRSTKSAKLKFQSFLKQKLKRDDIPLNNVSDSLCEEYKDWLLKQEGLSQNTASMYFTKLKTVLNQAVREKLLSTNPAKFIRIKNIGSEKVYLTLEEVSLIEQTESKYRDVKEAFLFGCYTGLRVSDIKKLRWEYIKQNKLFFRQEKTKNVEYLPLNKNAIRILELQKSKNRESEFVFYLAKKSANVNTALRKFIKNTEIDKHITFHSSRHTFATLCLTWGMDLYSVSKLLGHKSIQNTQIYAQIINQKLEQEANKFPIIE